MSPHVVHLVQACMSADLPGEDCKTKMGHMSKMFQMYATKKFVNGRDLWLAGICRYLNDAYVPLAVKVRQSNKQPACEPNPSLGIEFTMGQLHCN